MSIGRFVIFVDDIGGRSVIDGVGDGAARDGLSTEKRGQNPRRPEDQWLSAFYVGPNPVLAPAEPLTTSPEPVQTGYNSQWSKRVVIFACEVGNTSIAPTADDSLISWETTVGSPSKVGSMAAEVKDGAEV